MSGEAEVLDASQAADLANLQAMAGEDLGAADMPPEVSPADQVEMMFRPAFAMMAGMGRKNEAFYTSSRARQAAEVFVALAEAEGWSLDGFSGKWALRVAFLMVVTPPHAVEWVLSRVMAFGRPEPEPEGKGDEDQ